ncbi:MAG: hypothetical protein INR62_07450 [Rhodospirillales bacterium]|nr:hypothetical protein [Acetobacter sp.]
MHLSIVLEKIYQEHHSSVPRMVETLLDLAVSAQDTALLGRMPWPFPANRIAVERERLSLSPVPSLPRFDRPFQLPPRLRSVLVEEIVQLASGDVGNLLPRFVGDGNYESDGPDGRTLILVA